MSGSARRVCGLPGCAKPVEDPPSGPPRKYCCAEHRKQARWLRLEQSLKPDEPTPRPGNDRPVGAAAAPVPRTKRQADRRSSRQRLEPANPNRYAARFEIRGPGASSLEPTERETTSSKRHRARPSRGTRGERRSPSSTAQASVPTIPAAAPDPGTSRPRPAPSAGPTIPTPAAAKPGGPARKPATTAAASSPAAPAVEPVQEPVLSSPVPTTRPSAPPATSAAARSAAPKPVPEPAAVPPLPEERPPSRQSSRLRRERRRRAKAELARLLAQEREFEADFAPKPRWRPPRLSFRDRVTRAGETLRAALHSLAVNRLRSVLTCVGIVIGVAAVIVLVALGNGMKANFNAQFSRLANQITLTPVAGSTPGGGVARKLTDSDVAALSDPNQAPHIASVSPVMTGTVMLTAGQNQERANMVGATENYLDLLDRTVIAGSWFTSQQAAGNDRVAVLGQQAVALLWGPTANLDQVVGSQIRVSRSTFKVVGVLDSNGQNDNVAIVPFKTSRTYLVGNGSGEVDQIIIKSTSVDTLDAATDEITRILDTRHGIDRPTNRDYNVLSFADLLAKSTQFINFLSLFIVAIAAISLIVGGIGVANIMLVSVTERTREIGIRKAIGATRRNILRQFLSEAVMLTGLGGLVGVILGVGITLGGGSTIAKLAPDFPAPVLTPWPVLIAFAVSIAIGVVAGVYPALRAARMTPIQALRFE